jgi:hypothetical protein
MTTGSKFVSYYLWIAPHILLFAAPVLMYTSRLHKRFPLFFFYTLYEISEFLLLFAIYVLVPTRGVLYQYVFIATLVGSAALRFGIVQEVCHDLFHDYPSIESLATTGMRRLTALLLLGAVLSAIYSSGATQDHLMAGVALLDRSIAIIQAGLLLFLVLAARMFGVSERSFPFGIAVGFGLIATTDLAVWAIHLAGVDLPFVRFLNLVMTGSYHVSVLIWIGYLLTAEKPAAAASFAVPELDQWHGELGRSL